MLRAVWCWRLHARHKLPRVKLFSFYAPQNYALPGMPEREKRSLAHWVAEHEVKPPPQKTRKKHEPGHKPIAAPAMLEGYASTRPPRTEQ